VTLSKSSIGLYPLFTSLGFSDFGTQPGIMGERMDALRQSVKVESSGSTAHTGHE